MAARLVLVTDDTDPSAYARAPRLTRQVTQVLGLVGASLLAGPRAVRHAFSSAILRVLPAPRLATVHVVRPAEAQHLRLVRSS